MSPLSRTTIVSDIVRASSWSCVTNINVIPNLFCISLSSVCIPCLNFKSSAPNGSSKRSTLGSFTSERAIATLCCCPPLNAFAFLFSYPSRFTRASILVTFSLISFLDNFLIFNPKAILSYTFICGKSAYF